MKTANTAIVQRAFDCWNKRELPAIAELFSDCIYHSPATGDLVGRDYTRYFTSLLNAFPDGWLTVLDQIEEGEKVVVRWSFTGTHKRELMGIAPTGKQIAMTGMSIIRLRNGKIVEAWEEWDNLGLMQKLGILPAVHLEMPIAV